MIVKGELLNNKKYSELLNEIKSKIRSAQLKAAVSVNKELLSLYWQIGKRIVEEQKKTNWGDSFIEKLAYDLRKEFPSLKGFSRTNIFNIRKWYLFYSKADKKVQQLVGQVPWGHNVLIINKSRTIKEAAFYIYETTNNNWSRNVLLNNIDFGLYSRNGKSINNFTITMPKIQSDLAIETIKDPYIFDFLTLSEKYSEKEFENELMHHIVSFLLELGAGFAFVGKQYHLEVSKTDYYIDLLFYHLKLRCYIVIELKIGEFKPEYAGKLNFYLSVVDNQLKKKDDNPSIGIILCKTKDKITAEYSLRDIKKPIGVSEYKLVKAIPKNLKPELPSVAELEKELGKDAIKKRQ